MMYGLYVKYYSYYFCADKGQKNYIFRRKLYNSNLLQSQGIYRRITMAQLILVVLDDKFLGLGIVKKITIELNLNK